MADLRTVIQQQVDKGNAPGLVVLVARNDDVVVEAAGVRRIGGEAMTRDTICRVASITKPLTAALTMMLVEDGRIGLDDPVAGLLPELSEPRVLRDPMGPVDDTVACERPITTRDLLTFQAGIGFPADFSAPVCSLLFEQLLQGPPQPAAVPEPDEWMRRLAGVPLLHQPGAGWTYNTGSDILGVLLARASGMPLPGLVEERLTGPLGMVDTAFAVPRGSLDRMATYYRHTEEGAGLVVADEPDGQWASMPRFPSGAGGLVSTVDDWLAFGRMLLARGSHEGRRILSAASVDLMLTDTTTPQMRAAAGVFLEGQGWGFGGSVDVAETNPWNAIGRYGWIGGTMTAGYVDPALGTVTVLLAQVEVGGPGTEDLLGSTLTAAREQVAPRPRADRT
jgi:CubicO group peptidase (beta-lactamase class C family)